MTSDEKEQQFDTGVRIYSVNGKRGDDSIRFDDAYKMNWSDVLESLLGDMKT